jgi:ectoine hydroxylase-related dioxygenase (phytanoyl-CoA dioxygenase family)
MDPSCLHYALTEAERTQFEKQGYLIVPDVLTQAQIDPLVQAVDRLHAERGLGPHEDLFYPNFVWRDPAFVELVDCPRILPKIWGILGWNIYLYHCHFGVNPPVAPDADRTKKTLGWHQDSGRVNTEMESHPRPRLSLKVAFFLTDMREPGRGNFWIIPGSQCQDTLDRPANGIDDPPGAMPVCVPAGTAVFFDRRLWHAASPNHSDRTRKVLFYGYGYRWLRTKDDMTIPPQLLEQSDPIRRQLLGGGVNANGRFSPTDDDVPLRVWLRAHQPEAAR